MQPKDAPKYICKHRVSNSSVRYCYIYTKKNLDSHLKYLAEKKYKLIALYRCNYEIVTEL